MLLAGTAIGCVAKRVCSWLVGQTDRQTTVDVLIMDLLAWRACMLDHIYVPTYLVGDGQARKSAQLVKEQKI